MTDQQKEIYKLILKREVMTVQSIVVLLKIPEAQAYADLEFLANKDFIETRMVTDFRWPDERVKTYCSPLFDFEDELPDEWFK